MSLQFLTHMYMHVTAFSDAYDAYACQTEQRYGQDNTSCNCTSAVIVAVTHVCTLTMDC